MYAEGKVALDPHAEFAVKSCPGCGDKLHIMNSDVINLSADDNGDVKLHCPICGNTFKLHKYFAGVVYTAEQYCSIASLMSVAIGDVCIKLDEINRGYGTEYISIADICIRTSGIDISIDVYIDRYKYGNWEVCEKPNVYYTTFKLFPYEFLYCDDVRDYAAYVQAAADYICNTALINRTNYKYGHIRSDVDLVAFIRGGDTLINFDRYDKYLERRNAAEADRKTIYCPDLLTGANTIHDGVINAGKLVKDGLYTVAMSIGGISNAIGETPNQVYLINRY